MKIDRYLKIILTIIALCLVWVSVRSAFPIVRASEDSVPATGQQMWTVTDYRIAWNRMENRGIVQLRLAGTNQLVTIDKIPSVGELTSWKSILTTGKTKIDSNGWIFGEGQELMK
jgi:hypothetical protein